MWTKVGEIHTDALVVDSNVNYVVDEDGNILRWEEEDASQE